MRLIIHVLIRKLFRRVEAILLEIEDRTAFRRVDGEEIEIRSPQALQLRVQVREIAALQQRIIREINP